MYLTIFLIAGSLAIISRPTTSFTVISSPTKNSFPPTGGGTWKYGGDRSHDKTHRRENVILYSKHKDNELVKRRAVMNLFTANAASLLFTTILSSRAYADELESTPEEKPQKKLEEGETLVFATKSGLKYIDLKEGDGPSPRYGQLCTFSYKGYIKVAGNSKEKTKPEMFEKDSGYLTKHGNGRLIPGLDEGLHSMKVGGIRRIIIPPKLGYVTSGLGPIPEGFIARYKLNKLLRDMVEKKGGQVIFEVELLGVIDDEADQGYYEDDSLSPEDFNTLRLNLQGSVMKARESEISGEI